MHLETLPFLEEYYQSIYKLSNCTDIKISKDVDFNFGIKDRGKYNRFLRILKNDNGEKYIEKLNYCKENTHTLFNFSLFPATGAMNNARNWTEDRIDSCPSVTRRGKIYFNKERPELNRGDEDYV